jgi:hypothetical protein
MKTTEGKIAAILSPVKVVINKGSTDGVQRGDYFLIYSELGHSLTLTRTKTWGLRNRYGEGLK